MVKIHRLISSELKAQHSSYLDDEDRAHRLPHRMDDGELPESWLPTPVANPARRSDRRGDLEIQVVVHLL